MTVNTFDFEQLLWPEPVDDFMRDHFLKRPYVLPREDPHYYDGFISLADVESFAFSVKTPESYHQQWLDISKGDHHPAVNELFNERGIIPARVISYYQQGYTLALNRAQHQWPAIHLLCKNIEESLSRYTYPLPFGTVYAGLFLTPPDAQGLSLHYDMVDVFILQLEGSKQWSIYNQSEMFPSQRSAHLNKEVLGDPMLTLRLNPGDMLYVPAGYPHEAYTDKGHSLHLSVGGTPYQWKHVISDLVAMDKGLSNPLPLELTEADATTTLVEQFDKLMQQLSSPESLTVVLEKLKGFHLTSQMLLADDYLHQINQMDEITLQTRLCKRHDQAYQMMGTSTQLSLQFPGNTLLLPREVKATLLFIFKNDDFTVGSLPGMKHDEARLSLVRQLVGGGFLKTVPQGDHAYL
jgi:Cupin superfamily protein